MKRAILLMAVLAAAGCGSANSTSASSTSVGVFTTTDLVVGTGTTAANGNTVSVNYAGWLYDCGMKVGGQRRVIIPPELAYGSNPPSGIPANATLIFDITLNSVQ
jgi:FKBP-type peptidyl-prolyl cis-trans isomerase